MATPSRGHHFPWFYKELSSQKRFHSVVHMGGVEKHYGVVIHALVGDQKET